MPTYTLGFSGLAGAHSVANGHNPAAALLKDGRFIAGAAEERFNRVKNSPGMFPEKSIRWVLDSAGIGIEDVTTVAWANDPRGAAERWSQRGDGKAVRKAVSKIAGVVDAKRSPVAAKAANLLNASLRPSQLIAYQQAQFVDTFGKVALDLPFECVDHHLSHAASAYFPSGMEEATVITWDGSGDGLSGSVRHGSAGGMTTVAEYGDFSIGELYWAVHKYLKLSDEGSLMGLAAYGKPNGALEPYVRARDLWMDLAAISGYHHPVYQNMFYSLDVMERLAPPRQPDDELLPAHRDLAAELQARVEEFCFEITRRAVEATGCRRVALAGGVALNAVFNGKLGRSADLCDELFVQPNPGDEGGALGAAYVVAQQQGVNVDDPMTHAYFGRSSSNAEIEAALKGAGVTYQFLDDDMLLEHVAEQIANGKIIGWYQGAMEWGPRALGNRSILADPRNADAGERVNVAVKYRDPWRPFAPSLLAEAAEAYLVDPFYSPFMITTFQVRPDKVSEVPSIVHADGSTRPQMVRRDVNPRYYGLIEAFGRRTGTPILLNTSFNLKGEPIVCKPLDAVRTFFSSGIDLLVMENYLVTKGS